MQEYVSLPDWMRWQDVCAMLEQMQVSQFHPVGLHLDRQLRCWLEGGYLRCKWIGEGKGVLEDIYEV